MLDCAQSATAHSVEDTHTLREECKGVLHLDYTYLFSKLGWLKMNSTANRNKRLHLIHKIQIGGVAYPLGTGVSYLGEKAAGSQS
jgi:hypothetical protein